MSQKLIMFTKPQRLESLDESHPIKEKEEKKEYKKNRLQSIVKSS